MTPLVPLNMGPGIRLGGNRPRIEALVALSRTRISQKGRRYLRRGTVGWLRRHVLTPGLERAGFVVVSIGRPRPYIRFHI